MKPRLTLMNKIILLAIGNFAFIGLMFAAFLFLQFRQDLQSTLLAPVRDRMGGIARELMLELQQYEPGDRDELLRRHSAELGMDLYLFLNDGPQIAGPPVSLPVEVADELLRRPPIDRKPAGGAPPFAAGGVSKGPPPPTGPVNVFFVWAKGDVPYWVGARMPVRSAEGDERGTLMVGMSSLWTSPFFYETWTWLGIIVATALISVLFWLPLVRGLTRNIDQMMHATATIADGNFNVDLGRKRNDELGMLAASITRMASRLETFVKGQKRFLGDVAHELRSPLGRMRIASEILERKAEPPADRYVADMKEDVELMSQLTDQLLAFAKAELRPDSVSLVPTKVADVVQRAVQVEAGQADVRVDVNPELQALAEPEYLFRSVSNLVRNSLRYAAEDGPIEITARADDGNVLITVSDSGPGVPEESLEKIFEPFFRVDTSRHRKTGGTGLGLAIVRTCIEACHGSIECRNRKPTGLMITLRLARA
jgi:two-component system, OmpR family, sensor histidine kinase CpxA